VPTGTGGISSKKKGPQMKEPEKKAPQVKELQETQQKPQRKALGVEGQ